MSSGAAKSVALTPLDAAVAAVGAAHARILRHLEAARQGGAPESLHRIRVGLRRLRAVGETFGPVIDLPKPLRPPAVARLARKLGRARDFDVLASRLSELASDLPPGSSGVADELAARLAKRRRRAAREVLQVLDSRRFGNLVDAAEAWGAAPVAMPAGLLPLREVLPDLAAPVLSAVLLHPGWWVGTVEGKDGRRRSGGIPAAAVLRAMLAGERRALHGLRRAVKHLRYQSEALRSHLPEAAREIEHLRAAQDVLGDLHDLEVLRAALADLDPDWAARARLLDRRIAAAERRAWRAWLPLRRPLLTPTGRGSMRRRLGSVD